MKEISSIKFIEDYFIKDIGELVELKKVLFSFNLIVQGIEVLGSFFDNKPLEKEGMSKKRFEKGLELLGEEYIEHEEYLYKNLRCGLVHQSRPQERITLASSDNKLRRETHLITGNRSGNFFIIIEEFYEDFKKACRNVIDKIEEPNNNEIDHNKRKMVFVYKGKTQFNIDVEKGKIDENKLFL